MMSFRRKRSARHRFTFLFLVWSSYGGAGFGQNLSLTSERIIFSGHETDRCLKCHGMQNFVYREPVQGGGRVRNLTVVADTFRNSVHKGISCQFCHAEIKEYPHLLSGERPRIECGATCHAADREGKPYSHATTYADYRTSAHSKGLTDTASGSPTCVSCHGEGNPHGIHQAKNSLSKRERMSLCVTCHENRALMASKHVDEDAVQSYRQSFHYKAIRFGETNTAVCQDCHTVHRILPSDSAASSIGAKNIASTCGQQNCHPGVNMNFAMSGANHLGFRIGKNAVLFAEEKLFVVLTLGTMSMLVIGILLDVQKKYGWLSLLVRITRAAQRRQARLQIIGRKLMLFGKRVLID